MKKLSLSTKTSSSSKRKQASSSESISTTTSSIPTAAAPSTAKAKKSAFSLDFIPSSPTVSCPICSSDLGHLSSSERDTHVNSCLDTSIPTKSTNATTKTSSNVTRNPPAFSSDEDYASSTNTIASLSSLNGSPRKKVKTHNQSNAQPTPVVAKTMSAMNISSSDESDQEFICFVCGKDLSLNSMVFREDHLNRCLDESVSSSASSSSSSSSSSASSIKKPTAKDAFANGEEERSILMSLTLCPLPKCDTTFTPESDSLRQRITHVKACCKKFNVPLHTIPSLLKSSKQRNIVRHWLKTGKDAEKKDEEMSLLGSSRQRQEPVLFDDVQDNVNNSSAEEGVEVVDLINNRGSGSNNVDSKNLKSLSFIVESKDADFEDTPMVIRPKSLFSQQPAPSTSSSSLQQKPAASSKRLDKTDEELQLALALSVSLKASEPSKKEKQKLARDTSNILAVEEAHQHARQKAVKVVLGTKYGKRKGDGSLNESVSKPSLWEMTAQATHSADELITDVLKTVDCTKQSDSEPEIYNTISSIEKEYRKKIDARTKQVEQEIERLRQQHTEWVNGMIQERDQKILKIAENADGECSYPILKDPKPKTGASSKSSSKPTELEKEKELQVNIPELVNAMPRYETMEVKELKNQIQTYGVRPTGRKIDLIHHLRKIWLALQKVPQDRTQEILEIVNERFPIVTRGGKKTATASAKVNDSSKSGTGASKKVGKSKAKGKAKVVEEEEEKESSDDGEKEDGTEGGEGEEDEYDDEEHLNKLAQMSFIPPEEILDASTEASLSSTDEMDVSIDDKAISVQALSKNIAQFIQAEPDLFTRVATYKPIDADSFFAKFSSSQLGFGTSKSSKKLKEKVLTTLDKMNINYFVPSEKRVRKQKRKKGSTSTTTKKKQQ